MKKKRLFFNKAFFKNKCTKCFTIIKTKKSEKGCNMLFYKSWSKGKHYKQWLKNNSKTLAKIFGFVIKKRRSCRCKSNDLTKIQLSSFWVTFRPQTITNPVETFVDIRVKSNSQQQLQAFKNFCLLQKCLDYFRSHWEQICLNGKSSSLIGSMHYFRHIFQSSLLHTLMY